ncbi:hypothetical protein HY605_01825 [Candidatus Peregrinibacteria bacterium]|nr:hypothetical protein [Candidatus Peregrinibacteria bacterium]
MPSTKTRMQFHVDIDVAEWFEDRWRDECRRCMDNRSKMPTFSSFMNNYLKQVMVERGSTNR